MLLVRLPVHGRLLVKSWGVKKSYAHCWLSGSVPLIPMLVRGQLYEHGPRVASSGQLGPPPRKPAAQGFCSPLSHSRSCCPGDSNTQTQVFGLSVLRQALTAGLWQVGPLVLGKWRYTVPTCKEYWARPQVGLTRGVRGGKVHVMANLTKSPTCDQVETGSSYSLPCGYLQFPGRCLSWADTWPSALSSLVPLELAAASPPGLPTMNKQNRGVDMALWIVTSDSQQSRWSTGFGMEHLFS